ncbi:MAG: thiamine pyrophosphate-dependent enzyme [Chloroflexota bacterium]
MLSTAQLLDKYFLVDKLPNIWCAGCGDGAVAAALARAIDDLGLDKDKVAQVNGIGCSGRVGAYQDFDVIKGTHGRALTFATGIKLFKPELTVVAIMGDGDCGAIGGNHFIHAARRNINLTALVINNRIYGMTGGQASPTTPFGDRASTALHGSLERPFDLCQLAVGAGASYVARGTVYHIKQLQRLLKTAIAHQGFSFVEVISQCPVYYGRYNEGQTPAEMLRWQKENAVPVAKASEMSAEQLHGKIVTGEFVSKEEPEFVTEYQALIERYRQEAAE